MFASQEGGDGGGELVPHGALLAERGLPGRGEVVGAAAASADGLPVAGDQPGAFQPVQRG